MSAVLGAIIGDIAGSKYEFHNIFTKDFELLDKDCFFTDDTVLTLAIAKACKHKLNYAETLREVCKTNDYIHDYKCSFGARYIDFVLTSKANFSYGNGSAIRVAYLGQHLTSLSSVLKEAEASAIASHTHPDAIAGAKCIAGATHLAKKGSSKKEILEFAQKFYKIDLNKIKPSPAFKVSCAGSIPPAIKAVMTTKNFEDCIKTAISYGGDSDCIANMAGSIAGALYPKEVKKYKNKALTYLDDYLLSLYNDVK